MAQYTLSGDVATLLGSDHTPGEPAALFLESSQPILVVDGTGRLGGRVQIPLASDGTFTLPDIPETIADAAPLYRLQYDSLSLRRSGNRRGATTGWFPMTTNRDLTWVVANYVDTVLVTAQIAGNIAAAAALGATNDTASASYVDNSGSATAEALFEAVSVSGGYINQSLRKQFAMGGRVWIPAQMFFPGSGVGGTAASVTHAGNRWNSWLMDSAALERLSALIDLPAEWSSVDVDLVWSNASTGTGNIVVSAYLSRYGDGEASTKSVTKITNAVTIAAGAQNVLKFSTIATDVTVTPGLLTGILLDREGQAAGDTLANDAAFIGLLIRRKVTAPSASLMVDNGAWCWFNEPRFIGYRGTRNKVYAGYVTSNGSIGVTSLDTDTGSRRDFILHSELQVDDHDVPGLVVLNDGRIQAYYSKHSVAGSPVYMRTTINPESVGSWGPEVELYDIVPGGGPCYPKPARVGSRIYLFFRGSVTNQQWFTYSDDEGATWAPEKRWFTTSDGRPYVNFHASPDGRIDFIATNAHPTETNAVSLYHWYLLNGNVYKTDGTLISSVAAIPESLGLRTTDVTKVYDSTVQGDAWGWDLCRDSSGNPRVAFATFPTDTDHRYRYARWNGTAWSSVEVTAAGGGTVTENGSEVNYSGGISILDSNPNVVYLSRKVGTQWEIEKWTSADNGVTWVNAGSITSGSTSRQIRPTTPAYHYPGAPEVAWMSGRYTSYLSYDTDLLISPGREWPT